MFLDVNLGGGLSQRVVLCDGDDYMVVVEEFAFQHKLSDRKKEKLVHVIKEQLSTILSAIYEEDVTDHNSSVE